MRSARTPSIPQARSISWGLAALMSMRCRVRVAIWGLQTLVDCRRGANCVPDLSSATTRGWPREANGVHLYEALLVGGGHARDLDVAFAMARASETRPLAHTT